MLSIETAEIRKLWYTGQNVPQNILSIILSHYPTLKEEYYIKQINRIVVDDICISFYIWAKIFFCLNKPSTIPQAFQEQVRKILNPCVMDIREAIKIYICEIEKWDVPIQENIQIIHYDYKSWIITYDVASRSRKTFYLKVLSQYLWEGIKLINTEPWFIARVVR